MQPPIYSLPFVLPTAFVIRLPRYPTRSRPTVGRPIRNHLDEQPGGNIKSIDGRPAKAIDRHRRQSSRSAKIGNQIAHTLCRPIIAQFDRDLPIEGNGGIYWGIGADMRAKDKKRQAQTDRPVSPFMRGSDI